MNTVPEAQTMPTYATEPATAPETPAAQAAPSVLEQEPAPKPKPRPAMSQGKLRILQAVAALLEDPSTKITIQNIARRVHVTDAAIYRHFRAKEDIFASLADYMDSNFMAPLNAVQHESTDTAQRLHAVFNQYMVFFEGHPGLARLFLGHGATEAPGIPERIRQLNARIRSQIAQILRYGQATHSLMPGIEPEQAAELFYGLIVASAMAQAYDLPQITPESRWQAFCRAALGAETRAVAVSDFPESSSEGL